MGGGLYVQFIPSWAVGDFCDYRDAFRYYIPNNGHQGGSQMPKLISYICLLMLTAFIMPTIANAQSAGLAFEVPQLRNAVGIAVGVVPDYSGSDDVTVGVGPSGYVHWDDTYRYVKLVATELSVNVLNDKNWSIGPVINYRFGRSDVEDEVVKLTKDIDGTVEVGAFVGWTNVNKVDPRYRFNVSGQILADVGDTHSGVLGTLSARYWAPVAKPLVLTIGGSVSYASEEYNNTYYGVSATDASLSGLPTFTAEAGMRDFKISPMAIFSFSPNWHLGAGVVFSRLMGDAADSPFVSTRGDKNQIFAGMGLIYAW